MAIPAISKLSETKIFFGVRSLNFPLAKLAYKLTGCAVLQGG